MSKHRGHQEIGKILLRPRELMSAVVRGHEQHKLVTALYWARNASLARVGTHEVIQSGIDRTSLGSSGKSIVESLRSC